MGRGKDRRYKISLTIDISMAFFEVSTAPAKHICVMCEMLQYLLFIPDADHCSSCPEDQHPNENQDRCIPKKIRFLPYEEKIGSILASLALFLSLITFLVRATFIKHHDTPVIKAIKQRPHLRPPHLPPALLPLLLPLHWLTHKGHLSSTTNCF